MKAPKGMAWIDVTYMTRRLSFPEDALADIIEGEAGMQILINKTYAEYLASGHGFCGTSINIYLDALEHILQSRELLCCGEYIEGSIKDIRIMEDEDE